jgi:hypothetical protein
VITEIDQMTAVDRTAAAANDYQLPARWKRLVVRYLDGRLLKGFNLDFAPAKGLVQVWMAANGPKESCVTVPFKNLKAIFFVHDLSGAPVLQPGVDTRTECGRQIEVTFVDGEVLVGTTLSYTREGPGFFVTPLSGNGNNLSLFVVAGAVRQVRFP